MFELMEVSESICEGVLEPSYKNPAGEDSNRAGLRSKTRGETAPSTTYSNMSKSNGKRSKLCVNHPRDRSKLNRIIHGH